MQFVRNLLRWPTAEGEMFVSASRKVILTTAGVYLAFHLFATLAFPRVFSPNLWLCSAVILAAVLLSLRLLERFFALAQVIWFAGLAGAIVLGLQLFGRPETIFLLALLPLMAEVMVGLRSAMLLEGLVLLLAALWGSLSPPLAALPPGYPLALGLLSLACTFLGWGLLDNLVSAIEMSSYHYREALDRLEETRQHRAEISVLLTEVNKANVQLDRLNKMLSTARARAEEAREERNRFTLAVSHELRSPLNFVIGFSDLMVNAPETYAPLEAWPPGLYDDINEIYRSSSHLLSLINDILDMGKMDARQMPLFKEQVNMADLLHEVAGMIALPAEKKGLALRTEPAAGLPLLYVDRTRIRQVLLNLVTNALHFTTQGEIVMRARLDKPDLVRVEVEDTGAGIAEENLTKLFTEFRQVEDSNWRRGEGSGLGLAIGRRFVQMHGGEMAVHSVLGRGSLFYFTLPVLPAGDDLPAAEELAAHAESSSPRAFNEATPLVLFLSADLFWARSFADMLSGYKVSLLSDPDALTATVAQLYPRAVIIDQALAACDAVQAFSAAPPYDLAVITFAIPVNLNRITALPEGVQGYLLKPVDRHRLVETVRALGRETRTLLVVDDDPGMVRFVTQALRSAEEQDGQFARLELLTALTGTQALRYLENAAVDAVLLDLDLPDINGLLIIDQMQKDARWRSLPVIVISANDLPQSLTIERRGQFNISINRPLTRKELSDVLSAALGSVSPAYNGEKQG